MKKQNKIIRNIKFFMPMLLNISPFSIIIIILNALLDSISVFMFIIFPAKIIEELEGNKDIYIIGIIIGIFIISILIIKIIKGFFDVIIKKYTFKANLIVDELINNKVMKVDYFNIETPEFIDKLQKAKKGMSEYTNGIYSFVYMLQLVLCNIITILGVIGIVVYSKQYLIVIFATIGIIFNILIYRRIQDNNQNYNQTIFNFRIQKELRLFKGEEMLTDVCEIENKILHDKCMKHSKKVNLLNLADTTVMYGKRTGKI